MATFSTTTTTTTVLNPRVGELNDIHKTMVNIILDTITTSINHV